MTLFYKILFDLVLVWLDEERQDLILLDVAGGSRPERRPNNSRKLYDGYQQILHKFFGDNPVYGEKKFLWRFRMPH